MLPLSVSALASPQASAGDTPLGQPGEGATSTDFSALLTAQIAPPGPAAATTPSLVQLNAALPASPASLPESGNILPDTLPVGLPLAGPAADTNPTANPVEPGPAAGPVNTAAPIVVSLAHTITHKSDKAEDRPPEPASTDQPDDVPPVASDPVPVSVPMPVPAAPAVPMLTAAPTAQPNEADFNTGAMATARTSPPMMQPAPLPGEPVFTAQAPVASAAQPALPVLALDRAVLPAATNFTPPIPGEVPAPSLTTRVRLSDTLTPPTADLPLDTAPVAGDVLSIPLASPAASGAAPVTVPSTVPANRPHDFAALVDSLVAAREAAQPQAVSIALSHAEFGPVHLRFNHDEAGLSVSMASADPDFARAASQAMPAVQPGAASTDTASQPQNQQAARQNGGSAASGGFSQGQDRPTPERGTERAPRANPARREDSASNVRTGIFA